MIHSKRGTLRASCPTDTRRASVPAFAQELSSRAMPGSATSTGSISVEISALFSNISSSFFCPCLLGNFYGTPWGSSRRGICTSWTNPPSSGSFSGSTDPAFNQHRYLEMLKCHRLSWRTRSPPGNPSLSSGVQVNTEQRSTPHCCPHPQRYERLKFRGGVSKVPLPSLRNQIISVALNILRY